VIYDSGECLQAKTLKERLNGKVVEQTTGLKRIIIRDILADVKQLASEDELISRRSLGSFRRLAHWPGQNDGCIRTKMTLSAE